MGFLLFVGVVTTIVAEITILVKVSELKLNKFWFIIAAIGYTYVSVKVLNVLFTFKTVEELVVFIVSYVLCVICADRIMDRMI